ncbi:hypothetical protein DERP_008717 [Dermatophagoides pteronyssinus]|uniref:Uncharacterized protein n=1 Tax=Dermatophagoides pteronyssinus TaxID=6956 RepID=A0ABQ8IWE8_DERPT|nr:hypothetical protein DERP_008717 [Dermatophagoides pteronyssinus]
MVAKQRNSNPIDYAYRYQHDAQDVRTPEYRFVKYFNLLMAIGFLISSKNSAVTTWKWWTFTSVIVADLLGLMFIVRAIYAENPNQLITLSILSYVFAVWGLANVYLRGSIVCFVLPFTVATLSVIQFLMQRDEDKEFRISQELRCRRQPKPTMETFLDDHERAVEKL